MRYLIALLVGLGMASGVGCTGNTDAEPANRKECRAVQEHTASLRIAAVRVQSKLSDADLSKHEENFAQVTEAYLESCSRDRSKRWVQCMLRLESLGEASSCE